MKILKPEEIKEFITEATKENLTFCKNTKYYGIYKEGELVGFSGVLRYKNKTIFKNHWIKPKHRKKGYFKEMLDFLLNEYKGKIEATCTKMSINEYKKGGFKEIKKFKNGCVKVEYENL